MSADKNDKSADAEVIALAVEMGLGEVASSDPTAFVNAWRKARGYAERRLRPASIFDEPAATFRVPDRDRDS